MAAFSSVPMDRAFCSRSSPRWVQSTFRLKNSVVGPGDQVRIITSVGRKGKLKGKIIERLEERPVVSVGVVERMGRRNLVAVPMLGGGPVMLDNPPEARDVVGLAVRVKVTENQTSSRMAVGEVTEIPGDPQDPKVQLAIAVIGQGLPRVSRCGSRRRKLSLNRMKPVKKAVAI